MLADQLWRLSWWPPAFLNWSLHFWLWVELTIKFYALCPQLYVRPLPLCPLLDPSQEPELLSYFPHNTRAGLPWFRSLAEVLGNDVRFSGSAGREQVSKWASLQDEKFCLGGGWGSLQYGILRHKIPYIAWLIQWDPRELRAIHSMHVSHTCAGPIPFNGAHSRELPDGFCPEILTIF